MQIQLLAFVSASKAEQERNPENDKVSSVQNHIKSSESSFQHIFIG